MQQDEYTGKETSYIVFVYEDESPEYSADNQVQADRAWLLIKLITPKNYNYMKLKHKIRNGLENADFIVTSISSFLGDVYMGTEKQRTTVFQVEYVEQRNGGK